MMKKLFVFCVSLFFLVSAVHADQNVVQGFLVRSEYLKMGTHGIVEANNYRINQYTLLKPTKFMGKNVLMNKRVHASLKRVEEQIKNQCSDDYNPELVSSWRSDNSFKGHEISNHVFGIAIDLDPQKNTCCGCVADWAKVEGCQGLKQPTDGSKPLGPYVIPQCWIDAFKQNGWYWLGDEPTLRDTMHFEYLGVPQ